MALPKLNLEQNDIPLYNQVIDSLDSSTKPNSPPQPQSKTIQGTQDGSLTFKKQKYGS